MQGRIACDLLFLKIGIVYLTTRGVARGQALKGNDRNSAALIPGVKREPRSSSPGPSLNAEHPMSKAPRLEDCITYSPTNGTDEEESFSALLRRVLANSGLSLRQAAHRSWLDHSYLSRLVRQDWDPLNPPSSAPQDRIRHPSRDAVLRLALAMSLSVDQTDELLLAAGYAPLIKR